MSEFYVGQKVVCVDVKTPNIIGIPAANLKKGQIYTVSSVSLTRLGVEALTVEETVPAPACTGFHSWRFRPLPETSIEIFQAMLKPVPVSA